MGVPMTNPTGKALLLIDLQNDYYPGGAFPLWNTTQTTANILAAIAAARARQIPVVHIQHIADPAQGLSPFFNQGTAGAAIRPEIMAAAPDAPVVVKSYADSFIQTDLAAVLQRLEAREILVCGMMTQNCVTHTAISKHAEAYKAAILPDCCTTVSEMLHLIALHAVSTRMALVPSAAALA